MHHIIQHNDADGDASAAVVRKYLGAGVDVKFHRVSYGDAIPDINYVNDSVWVVDFSYQSAEVMGYLATQLGDRLTWIDHHQSAVEMCEQSAVCAQIRGIRVTEIDGVPRCGAELTWYYLFPSKELPPILQWVGDWDTWRGMKSDRASEVWAFNTALYDLKVFPEKKYEWWAKELTCLSWQGSSEADMRIREELATPGKVYVEFERKKNRGLLYNQGFEAVLHVGDEEYHVLAVNSNGGSLTFFDFFNPQRHDAMLKFFFREPGAFTVGLYSEDTDEVNCAEICKTLGHAGPTPSGGGHSGAGGFQTDWAHFQTLLTDVVTLKTLGKKIKEPRK